MEVHAVVCYYGSGSSWYEIHAIYANEFLAMEKASELNKDAFVEDAFGVKSFTVIGA